MSKENRIRAFEFVRSNAMRVLFHQMYRPHRRASILVSVRIASELNSAYLRGTKLARRSDISIRTIKDLKIAPLDELDINIASIRGAPGGQSVAVNARSVAAVDAGVSEQAQEDILYSMQLAPCAASAVADRYINVRAWYLEYVRVLTEAGWVMSGSI